MFSAIGRKTVWLGDAGQGSRMKLAVNSYLSILIEGVAETLELADRLGISPAQLADAIEGGPLDAATGGRQAAQDGAAATLPPSSRSSGPSRTSTWRSRQLKVTACRCSQPCPDNGGRPSTPATAGRMSVPLA